MKIKKKTGNMILVVLVIAFFGLILTNPASSQVFFGSFLGSIVGAPFQTESFSTDWSPSCSFASCYNPEINRMEGFSDEFASAAGVFRSNPFSETTLDQDYAIRAVSCETALNSDTVKNYLLGLNTTEVGEKSIHFVSQIQTKDGKWMDYYVSFFNDPPNSFSHSRIATVWKIPNSNEYTYHSVAGGQAIDLPNEIISNKVRCKFESGWQVPRYGGSIKVNLGFLKIYGEPVIPTCFDGIKNQNETEIDFGGVCGTVEAEPSIVCGDSVCNGNETTSTCPLDCIEISFQEPTEEGIGTHEEEVPEVGTVIVGNTLPEGISASNALFSGLLIGIVVLAVAMVYLVYFRK